MSARKWHLFLVGKHPRKGEKADNWYLFPIKRSSSIIRYDMKTRIDYYEIGFGHAMLFAIGFITAMVIFSLVPFKISNNAIALLGIAGTLLGAILGAWLGYRLSLNLSKNASRQKSILKLREAFRSELLALIPSQHALTEDLPPFLERSFEKHRQAIFDFAFYLEEDEKKELYQSWYQYYCPEENQSETSVPFFEQYTCMGFTTVQKHEMKAKVRKRIENILEKTK